MVVDTQLYDILGVQPDIDERGLKKAFMKKARDTHPDKHKDDPDATEKFQKVNEAYEILKDPQKREIYDKYGVEGLREGAGQSAGFEDILSHLFNININPRGGQRRQRTRDIFFETECTLEDMYNGKEKHIKITRHVVCKTCNGTGTADGKPPKECEKCGGQGRVIIQRQQGNSIYQTIAQCPDCHGTGEIVDEANKCKTCNGEKLVEEQKDVELHIERGAEEGDKMVFNGCSDEVPDAEAGDLIVILRQKDHDVFTRRHSDLLIKKKISLSEALFGARFPLTHLDGRILVIETNPKKTIQPNSVQVIPNEGMPIKGDPFTKGKLYIQFEVVFPEHSQLTKEFRHAMCKAIPHRDEAKNIDMKSDNVFQVTPEEGNIEDFRQAKKAKTERRNEAYKSDDEIDQEYDDDSDGQNVGCQPM